jgi:hypothetical protein
MATRAQREPEADERVHVSGATERRQQHVQGLAAGYGHGRSA